MKTPLITLALVAVLAAPAAAQTTATSKAVKVNTKVKSSLASTVKVSGDSAMAIARRAPDAGEISSIDLETKRGRLVYEVKMLNKNKGATEVQIDAMSGELVKDQKYGGAKATAVHNKENKKLLDAKRDSAKTKP